MTPAPAPGPHALRFRDELRDFLRFLRKPDLGPRLAPRPVGQGWWLDWFAPLPWGRLFKWAGFLWLLNALLFGPLAVFVAGLGGAQHKLDFSRIPWAQAIIWAPIVEELVFRFVLRRPSQWLAILPIALLCLFKGPIWPMQALLALALLVWLSRSTGFPRRAAPPGSSAPARLLAALRGQAWRFGSLRRYRALFPWVFYGATLAFAALHLYNFQLNATSWFLLPLLVLPQAATGLVLAWMRVRRGMGASIALHDIFNAGPILIVLLLLRVLGAPA